MDGLKLREATISDIDLIFEWANDIDERKYSFNPQKINYKDHCQWYEKRMNDEDTIIYILLRDTIAIGQCRIELEGDNALISYFIDKSYRNRGYGKRLLKMVEKVIRGKYPAIKSLKAQVKCDNKPSQKVFLAMGYIEKDFDKFKEYKLLL